LFIVLQSSALRNGNIQENYWNETRTSQSVALLSMEARQRNIPNASQKNSYGQRGKEEVTTQADDNKSKNQLKKTAIEPVSFQH